MLKMDKFTVKEKITNARIWQFSKKVLILQESNKFARNVIMLQEIIKFARNWQICK